MDADLVDWDTHFVRGLLGPLLADDGVALVKGLYERPSFDDGAGGRAGGRPCHRARRSTADRARVAELSWLVQPLAGEWAVRRDLFERLSVPTGYGVEMAALIDTLRLLGPDAIAQVDLGRRAHRPQALRDLGAMAVQILAASRRRSTGSAPDHVALDQHRKSGDRVETLRREIPLARASSGAGRRCGPLGRRNAGMTLRLGRHRFADDRRLMMAIVNRTPDSFYDKGATWSEDKAFDRVAEVVEQGAEIVDIGGIKAAPGVEIGAGGGDEPHGRLRRARASGPPGRGDQCRHLARVGRAARCARPVPTCSTTRGEAPTRVWSTSPRSTTWASSARTPGESPRGPARTGSSTPTWWPARSPTPRRTPSGRSLPGVARESIVIDPAHDFGKTTRDSLDLTRRLDEMVATGWPVLVSLSNKDFVGESLDLPVGERLTGTLAASAIATLHGARIFRVHEVVETRQVVDMVDVIYARRPPPALEGA